MKTFSFLILICFFLTKIKISFDCNLHSNLIQYTFLVAEFLDVNISYVYILRYVHFTAECMVQLRNVLILLRTSIINCTPCRLSETKIKSRWTNHIIFYHIDIIFSTLFMIHWAGCYRIRCVLSTINRRFD